MKRACLGGAVSALAALAWIQRPDIVVGALEYAVCADTPFVAVRPLFAKVGGRWTSLEEPAAFERVVGFPERAWTIAFDGRTIGTVRRRRRRLITRSGVTRTWASAAGRDRCGPQDRRGGRG